MTPAEGQKRVKAILGERAAWRDSKTATSPEARKYAHERLTLLRDEYARVTALREARMRELLADPQYQQLAAQAATLRKERDQAQSNALRYRLLVGINKGWCFEVKAEGDNWSDVVSKLAAKERAS
jgi:hypothetical protein